MTYRGAQNLIKRGDEPGLRAALDTGLDPNLVNQNGWTLLMLAAVEGALPLVRLLLEKGADASIANSKGETALTIAQHRGYGELASVLEEHASGS